MADMNMADMVKGVLSNQVTKSPYAAAGIDVSGARYEDALPLEAIDPWPGNRDLSEDAIERLAGDIDENGVLQPVLVRPRAYGRYQLVAGHHRVEAVKLLASKDPSDARWKGVKALVLEMDDDEAERAVLSTNVYMIPAWTPEERGAEWMRLSERARALRDEDPERYGGKRINFIVAELAEEAGFKVSGATVARDKAAFESSRKKVPETTFEGLIDPWVSKLKSGAIKPAQAKRISAMGPEEQAALFGRFAQKRGYGKRWLDAALAGDGAKRDAEGERALAKAVEDLDVLSALVENGYDADTTMIGVLIAKIRSGAGRRGR